ncbi:hypothetical protein LWI29_016508 [Acer saccharum]|uniref:Poly A polymerase head domain-containing protein n=1 Tax=Acer saccharum TaxID=4024 RepID=A0AA39TSR7_ACESA|nr:hypothetical protein LWI29_016508 [Acer saccharum]
MAEPTAVQVKEKIDLSDTEKDIFDTLLKTLRDPELSGDFKPNTVLRVAGGWVRDKLLGKECCDIDIALDIMSGTEFANKVAEYKEVKNLSAEEKKKYLSATDRKPPAGVGIIESLFYNINTNSVEDLTGRGIEDLKSGKIVTPLPPKATFLDDPLRVLRAIRFGSRFVFILDEELKKAATSDEVKTALAAKISRERIGIEISIVNYIFRVSLKLKASDAETVINIHRASDEDNFLSLIPSLVSANNDVSELRVLTGSLLREIKDFWRVALLISTLLYPTDVDCTQDILGKNFQLAKRRDLFMEVENAIIKLGLEKVWDVKPLVNGKEIMNVLQLKSGGPLVRKWIALVRPSTSRALCNARTVARFRKASGSSSTPGILNPKWSRTSTKMLKIKNLNRVLALPATGPRERDFIRVPLRTVFAGNHHRITLPVLIPEVPVTSPQNQGQPVGDQTMDGPVQNEIIDLNQAAVPDAAFGAPQGDAGGKLNNTADGPLENGNRQNDMGNMVQGENVPAAPAPPPEFNITQGGVTLNLPIHNDPQNEPPTTCILVAARIEEQAYFR